LISFRLFSANSSFIFWNILKDKHTAYFIPDYEWMLRLTSTNILLSSFRFNAQLLSSNSTSFFHCLHQRFQHLRFPSRISIHLQSIRSPTHFSCFNPDSGLVNKCYNAIKIDSNYTPPLAIVWLYHSFFINKASSTFLHLKIMSQYKNIITSNAAILLNRK
jgi:hypothetical protein